MDHFSELHILDCFAFANAVLLEQDKQEEFLALMQSNISHIENDMNISYNIPKGDLEIFGHMFIYSFLCPKFKIDWTQFYTDLLQNASPDNVVLNLNRLMVNGRIKGDKTNVNLSKRIVEKIAQNYCEAQARVRLEVMSANYWLQ